MDVLKRTRRSHVRYLAAMTGSSHAEIMTAIEDLFEEAKVGMTKRPFVFKIKE